MYRNCIFQGQATSLFPWLCRSYSLDGKSLCTCLPEYFSISSAAAIDQITLGSHPHHSSSLLSGLIAFSFSAVKQSLKYTNKIILLSLGSLASKILRIMSQNINT